MKKTIILSFIVLCFAGCGKNNDPLAEAKKAVEQEIIGMNEGLKSVYFTEFSVADSTTKAQELARRRALFETKKRVEEKKEAEFAKMGMFKNAANKRASILECDRILAGIDSLATMPDKDSVIYYTVKFIASGSGLKQDKAFAVLSSENKVLKIGYGEPNREHLGSSVPGYVKLAKGAEE